MTLFDDLITIAPADASEDDQPYWPHSGQEFEIYVAAMPDLDGVDGSLELVLVNSDYHAPEVSSVLCDVSGDHVTDDMFAGDLPSSIGLWKMKIKFFVDPYTDWESGQRDDDYGFEILSSEKV
jgi:hypothetical protein